MPILKNWLQSSQDPTQVSNTVRGAVLSASALLVFFAAQFFHVTLTASDIMSLATEVGALAGVLWFFYGLIFKGVMYAGTVKPSPTVVYTYNTSGGIVGSNTANIVVPPTPPASA